MSDLIAVAYPDKDTAEAVRDKLFTGPRPAVPRVARCGAA